MDTSDGSQGMADTAGPAVVGGVAPFPAFATPPRASWRIVTAADEHAISMSTSIAKPGSLAGAPYRATPSSRRVGCS